MCPFHSNATTHIQIYLHTPLIFSFKINGAAMHLAADGVTYTPYVNIGVEGGETQLCSFDEGMTPFFLCVAPKRVSCASEWMFVGGELWVGGQDGADG